MSKHYRTNPERGKIPAVVPQKDICNVTPIRKASNPDAHSSSQPMHMEQIVRRRAYELYEQRGRKNGHAEEDWLHAEAEVVRTTLRRAAIE
jgi:Protein of unknown function (DUF2934)